MIQSDKTKALSKSFDSAAVKPMYSKATRYLSCAVYTDIKLRRNIIDLERHLVIAKTTEFGLNKDFLLKHCWIAESRRKTRNLVLTCVLVCAIIFSTQSNFLSDLQEYGILGSDGTLLFIMFWIFALGTITFEKYFNEKRTLIDDLAPNNFGSVGASNNSMQNVVVYGSFSPFVGSGTSLNGWSFAINLEHKKLSEGKQLQNDFELEDLYDALRQGFERLGIDNLTLTDRIFVNGRSIRYDQRFLPNRFSAPVDYVDKDTIKKFLRSTEPHARHYLCAELSDVGNEIFMSSFIRMKKSSSKLFIEVNNNLLPSLKESYLKIEKLNEEKSFKKINRILKYSLLESFFAFMFSPLSLIENIIYLGTTSKKEEIFKKINEDPHFNYGATTSIRELAASANCGIYFQKLDNEMFQKVLQQQTLDVITEFLDDKGIDISEIKDRRSYILNHGIIVSGGSVTTESLAVGTGATSNKNTNLEVGKKAS